MIKLYYFHPGCSMASHIALEEAGVAYEAQAINPKDAGDRAALLELNPKGAVPTLVVDGEVLTENVAVLCYVASLAPERQLAPRDAFQYAQCLSFISWCSNTVHIAFRQSFRPERFSANADAHAGIRALGRENFWKAMETIDARLSRSPFIMGAAFTIADTCPLVFYNWGLIGDYPMADLAHFTAFKDRMLARPAVHRILVKEGCRLAA